MKHSDEPAWKRLLRYLILTAGWIFLIGYLSFHLALNIQRYWTGSGDAPLYGGTERLLFLMSAEIIGLMTLMALVVILIYRREPDKRKFWHTVGKGAILAVLTGLVFWWGIERYFSPYETAAFAELPAGSWQQATGELTTVPIIEGRDTVKFLVRVGTSLLVQVVAITFTLYCAWTYRREE